MDEKLLQIIKDAAANNATVVLLAGGGGGSLDEWARKHLQATD
jgi:hypothetical protein